VTYISAAELARRLNKSREAVRQAIKDGRIKSYKRNGRSVMCHAVKAMAEFNGEVTTEPTIKNPPTTTVKTSDYGFLCWGAEQQDINETSEELEQSKNLKKQIDELPEDQIAKLNDSKARREHYLAEKARLEVQTMQGDLVPAADVKAAAFKKARTVRDSMLAIPDRVIPTLISMTDTRAAHQLLTEEIRTALRSLADG